MVELFVPGILTIIAIVVFIQYRCAPGLVEMVRTHPDETDEDVAWGGFGALIDGGDGSGLLWDSFGRMGKSKSGVHYKSIIHKPILIPWQELRVSPNTQKTGMFGRGQYRIFSCRLKVGAILVSKKVADRFSQYAT